MSEDVSRGRRPVEAAARGARRPAAQPARGGRVVAARARRAHERLERLSQPARAWPARALAERPEGDRVRARRAARALLARRGCSKATASNRCARQRPRSSATPSSASPSGPRCCMCTGASCRRDAGADRFITASLDIVRRCPSSTGASSTRPIRPPSNRRGADRAPAPPVRLPPAAAHSGSPGPPCRPSCGRSWPPGAAGASWSTCRRGLEPGAAVPLVCMLHGCTQDAASFAAATRMNETADRHGFIAVYPQQDRGDNPQGCWNWFLPEHQERDSRRARVDRRAGPRARSAPRRRGPSTPAASSSPACPPAARWRRSWPPPTPTSSPPSPCTPGSPTAPRPT